MQGNFKKENLCFAPGFDEGAELAVVTITPMLGGIEMELCPTHSERLAPELMKVYHCARQRWAEEREIAQRECDARQEQDMVQSKEQGLTYKAKLLTALDHDNDDNLLDLLIDLPPKARQYHDDLLHLEWLSQHSYIGR